jgi:methylthioribulose-1-phosphate dehydratase
MHTVAAEELASLVRWIYFRGWSPGTGGNYSVLLSRDPMRILVTPSGLDKGTVQSTDLITVDQTGRAIEGDGKPSAETLLHVAIYDKTDAKAIVHTHSIWNTLHSLGTGLELKGYEMLKGLAGVTSHDHTEVVPVLENSQDMPSLSAEVRGVIKPETHAFLLRGHGLYTWGDSLFAAKRHLEVLEFLFEVEGRRLGMG